MITFDLTVTAGSNTLNSGGQSYKVFNIIIHPSWNPWTLTNDLALLLLSDPIIYNKKVAPISIDDRTTGAGINVVLCGWGYTSLPGSTPNNLQYINLKTISITKCKSMLTGLNNGHLCTLTRSGEGACFGDSGSPLSSNGKQIGITSAVIPCAIGYPDIFTRVSFYASWINFYIKWY